ncbi:MAG: sensor histidine kinase [Bacteroidota bacterium]
MKHPVIAYRGWLIYYILIWTALAVVHVLVVRKFTGFGWEMALADGVFSQLIMGVLGLGVWFLVRFSFPGKKFSVKDIANSLLAGVVIVFLWLLVSGLLLHLTFNGKPEAGNHILSTWLLRFITGYFLYVILVSFYQLYNYNRILREQIEAESELRDKLRESELAYLRAQINPHFLFNALNSVSSLIATRPQQAQEAVVELSGYLRKILHMSSQRFVEVSEEKDHIQQMLQVEKIRFGERLRYQLNADKDCIHKTLPSLILQPLFENALKYGLHESTSPCHLELDISCNDGYLIITISNSYDQDAALIHGTGRGLQNVRQRLDILYQKKYKMMIDDKEERFTVTLKLPEEKLNEDQQENQSV